MEENQSLLKRKDGDTNPFRISFVDLKRQYSSIKDEIDQKISEVIEGGSYISAENVELFEKEFAKYLGVKYAIGVASGTEALTLSLEALGVGKGCEAITVANTFISTVDAITHNGADPVLVDCDPTTYTMRAEDVSRKIHPRTKAILPVHLYGNSVDMKPLLEIAEKKNLCLVEDACQAHGAECMSKKVGTLGICACFSFYPAKNLGAYGDGGMIVTNDSLLAERLRLLRNYGEGPKYYHSIVGYNSRLDEIQAAVLRVKLKHLDKWIQERRRIAHLYDELLDGISGIKLPCETAGTKHAYHLYVIRSNERDELRNALTRKGISTGIHYPVPIHLQGAYLHLNLPPRSFPITENVATQIISLPMFPELTDDEVTYVSKAIRDFQNQN